MTGALLTADPGPDWQSRVIANLYPAVVEPDGRHEVIVELRAHTARWTGLDARTIEGILRVYRAREAAGYADGYAFVAVFKNSGAAAGASLRHPHAQVVALRRPPLSVVTRLERLTGTCGSCAIVAAADERIVAQTPGFTAYVPDGSRTAFEVRIAPAVHAPRFSQSADDAPAELAAILHDVLERLRATLGEDAPFNIIVQSAPHGSRAQALVHWEIELVPRLENFGGFELGTGGFLVSRLPEDAAAVLRAACPAAARA